MVESPVTATAPHFLMLSTTKATRCRACKFSTPRNGPRDEAARREEVIKRKGKARVISDTSGSCRSGRRESSGRTLSEPGVTGGSKTGMGHLPPSTRQGLGYPDEPRSDGVEGGGIFWI